MEIYRNYNIPVLDLLWIHSTRVKNDLADKTGSCRPWGWQAKDMVGHFYCSQFVVGACRRSHLCLERERGWVKMGGWGVVNERTR